ncbi:hypothetical protein K8B33_06935 [Alcanivorax sp. JB21]|uniref:hypothetical protein n=1 Tax=Alcanivorax limicola TaxID=2874102 RepID=UPI001CBD70D6|nr:hypothetical protein [Alcanivorax limicola]MBZ2188824.1 hypothetical protein [Alcanivorax limicola]
MKIRTSQGVITGGELFNIVSHGWFIGILAIMFPFFILGALGLLLVGEFSLSGFLLVTFMVPLIIGIQALISAGIVLLGLCIFPPGKENSS